MSGPKLLKSLSPTAAKQGESLDAWAATSNWPLIHLAKTVQLEDGFDGNARSARLI
jgi:hypothetical protein